MHRVTVLPSKIEFEVAEGEAHRGVGDLLGAGGEGRDLAPPEEVERRVAGPHVGRLVDRNFSPVLLGCGDQPFAHGDTRLQAVDQLAQPDLLAVC